MDRLVPGHVVDSTYRVESVIAESDRALVYVVSHLRFPEVPLVMKVATVARAADFERDTAALAEMSSPSVVRLRDHHRLPDGRPYRVVERLAGPTLRQALMESTFNEDRTMELLVALSAATHEAQVAGFGPCDLSIDNLMFADGRDKRLCMMRVLVPDAEGADPEADANALVTLRIALERGLVPGRRAVITRPWKPPSNIEELRRAMVEAGAPRTPEVSAPGASIERWQVVRRVSETLRATVYEVTSAGGQPGILKIAGPEVDHGFFRRHSDLLSRVQSRHVVRVLDMGSYEGTPFVVMDPLRLTQSERARRSTVSIDAALQTVDELLWGAEAISRQGGAPSDFSLEHCYQATAESSPAVLTHAMSQGRSFGLHGRPSEAEHADAWAATVALYELIAGRLPFPTTKHSLARAWMGVPIPLATRRRDVPLEVSELVASVLGGTRMTTAELRRELTRIRSTPAAMRPPTEPPIDARRELGLQVPRASAPPAPPLPAPDPVPALRAIAADTPVYGGTFSSEGVMAPTALVSSAPRLSVEPPAVIIPSRRSIEPPAVVASQGARHGASVDWALDVAPARCPLSSLGAAAFAVDGREIVAVSRDAVARFRGGQWTVAPAREAGRVLSLAPMGPRAFLATTAAGPLLRLGETGGFARWGVALDRYCFYAASADGAGLLLCGGTQDRRRGVLARLVGESLTVVADNVGDAPLRSAARLDDGTVIAVAEGGSIVRLHESRTIESLRACDVDLLAVRVVGGEILVVGSGAWAFRVTTNPLHATLEAVETTSALLCLASDGAHAWAGSSKGRILRRRDGRWRRMNGVIEGDPAVLAIEATSERMRAILADGQLVIGRPV